MILQCVYIHKRKDTLTPFYVGLGNTTRPYTKKGRSKYPGGLHFKYI